MRKTIVFLGALLALPLAQNVTATPLMAPDVRTESLVHVVPLEGNPGTVYRVNSELQRGTLRSVSAAVPPLMERTVNRLLVDDTLKSEHLASERRIAGRPGMVHISPVGFASGRQSFTLHRVITMESTAYTPDAGLGSRATFRTRTGRRAAFGVVAVDPRVIPLNTLVFVEGYGLALACDTGGAIKGNKIDVCIENRRSALNWGRRTVRVHVFRETIGQAWVP